MKIKRLDSLNLWSLTMTALCALPLSVVGQSTSAIGAYLQPAWRPSGIWVMTRDSEWIAFVENDGAACDSSAYDERISLIRSDGTGHRVVVDEHVLKGLQAGQTRIVERLRISPDGRQIYIEQASYSVCNPVTAPQPFVVDVATGGVEPLTHNGYSAYLMSYSDSGDQIVFRSFDAELGDSYYFVSDPGLVNARPFVDTSPWWSTPQGKLSGDGSKFLFIVWHGSVWGDAFLVDMESLAITKLTPESLPALSSADISADGSRIVLGHSTADGALYATGSEGQGLRLIAEGPQATIATLSANGRVIFGYGGTVPVGVSSSAVTNIYNWHDGSLIDQYLGGGGSGGAAMGHMAVNDDGTLVSGGLGNAPEGHIPTMVRSWSSGMLTTYGFGDPGTPVHWDVCGSAASDWVLAVSLRKGLLPLPGVGELLLSRGHLIVLDAGTISGPYNASTVTREIPVDAALPEVLPLHSQALVVSPAGEARLTNRTTFELHGAQASTAEVAHTNGQKGLRDGPAQEVPWGATRRRPTLWELSPAERLRRMELMDPSIAWRRERGLLPAGSP